ncbi:hypothetical protein KY325_04470 [Candidatus Woesearchaeota archaeon]|nr:hypothetical protein [Candidatus Woesearchaeota archaeon]MBW3018389.1 hypothetical protein [Candidatus Woesearchaeota archaeon]
MATFLDVGLFSHFAIIFPFLLIFLVTYAVLQKFKMLTEERGINAIIALAVACLTLFSKAATALVFFMSPWFVLLFIFILFLLLAFQLMGTKWETIVDVMSKKWFTPHWILIFLIAFILLAGIASVFGPGLLGQGPEAGVGLVPTPIATLGGVPEVGANVTGLPSSTAYGAAVQNVLFHPKVLGLAALAVIIAFAIRTLIHMPPKKD